MHALHFGALLFILLAHAVLHTVRGHWRPPLEKAAQSFPWHQYCSTTVTLLLFGRDDTCGVCVLVRSDPTLPFPWPRLCAGYLRVSSTAIAFFRCVDLPNGASVVQSAPAVSCRSPEYERLRLLGSGCARACGHAHMFMRTCSSASVRACVHRVCMCS